MSQSISNLSHADLHAEVHRLRDLMRRMELSRERAEQKRRRRLVRLGITVSVIAHALLMVFLATRFRAGTPGTGVDAINIGFAIATEEELSGGMGEVSLDGLVPQDLAQFEQAPSEILPDVGAVSGAGLEAGAIGSVPLFGGSGAGGGNGSGDGFGEGGGTMGGGGGGTSFFGISSRGRRFAYIVDRSGSMGNDNKLIAAKEELTRSIQALPDYAQFYVIFFSSEVAMPPMQRSWLSAKSHIINNFITWLRGVESMGGTEAKMAIEHMFNMPVRPDVVFLLTDGQFNDIPPERIAELNRAGKHVIINTIAFGDPTGQDLLRQIAADSDGVYRFVPTASN